MMPHSESSVVQRAHLRGFPDRAFGRLAVAEQHVGAVVRLDAPRVQRDADAGAQPLPERAGGDVDPRQPRRRMAFEIGVELRSDSRSSRVQMPASAHAA